jgi:thiamine-phosphate pyrophosphorylase
MCLITDRRRLLAATGRGDHDWEGVLVDQLRGAIAGGVDLIQIRERDLEAARLAAIAGRIVDLTQGRATRVVVNDRVDIAVAVGAHGVHLREDGLAPYRVRAAWPPVMIGRSIHGAAAAASSNGVDYLIAGSVFETVSKPGQTRLLGLEGLRAVVGAAGPTPVLAVGGVTVENLALVRASGAAGFASIGAFLPSQQVSDLATGVQKLTETLRFAFDSRGGLP